MVGGALIARMRQAEAEVTGTTRRLGSPGELLHLDLSTDLSSWRPPQPGGTAILCAGVTGVQACEDDPAGSRRVNVEGIVQVAKNLHAAGVFVIYLSTNQVFDGSAPFRAPTDPTCPVTEYGRQKAEAERQLTAAGTVGVIVRLTKVLGPRNSLFSGWTQSLRAGQGIQAYSDMTFAPVPLSCVVDVLLLLAARRLGGIFQVSGEKDITYATAAQIGAEALGVEPRLVQSVKSAAARSVPIHTTLNVDSLKSATGVVPPAVRWTVETTFMQPQLLGG